MAGGVASTAGAASAEGAPRTAALHDGGATHAAARKARAAIGTPPAVPKGAHPISALRSSTTLQIQVVLTPQDPTALAAYAQEVSTPGSVYYRRFLDPAQFATVFGPSAQSIDTVDASLRAEGLVPGRISADHLSIPVRARAGALARGLSTSFTRYRLKSGRVVFANTKAPQLPAVAARSVQDIVGLDDLVVAQSGAVRVKGSRRAMTPPEGAPQVQTGGPQPCASADGGAASGAYTADEVASAYGFSSLYGQGDEGSWTKSSDPNPG
ncbi:MAG: protease pro-enzyme activation domain-containing protein [Acidimicrobiales bacterium]